MTTPEQETADPGKPVEATGQDDTNTPGSTEPNAAVDGQSADLAEQAVGAGAEGSGRAADVGGADQSAGVEADDSGQADTAGDSRVTDVASEQDSDSPIVAAADSDSAAAESGDDQAADADSTETADSIVGVDDAAAGGVDADADALSGPDAPSADSEPGPPEYPEDATELPLGIATTQADEADNEEDSEDQGETASRFPDLTEDEALHSALEALLLVVDSPAEVEDLADAVSQPVKRVRAALKTMSAQYHEQSRGIDLRDAGGGWRFYTRDKYAPFVEKLLHDGQRAKLTRAALESLAVIAYRQPVTRARVAAVRGVNVDGVIRTLVVRGLIEETGADKETGGILYRTTELFLERLGLSSLEDLPPIAPLLPEVDAIDDV